MKNNGKRKRSLSIAIAALTVFVACLFGFVGCDDAPEGPENPSEPTTYTISFVTGEGGSTVEAITAVAGAEIVRPADPTKANAVFDGWYANAEFTGEKATLPATMPEGGATYYAKFKDLYSMSFVTGEGGSAVEAITAVAGSAITPPADPTKANAVFDGWYANAEFSGERATLPATMPEGGATYYAKFIDKQVVSFVLAGGTVVKSVNDIPGAALVVPADPEKANAVFDGWYANADFSGGKVNVPATVPNSGATYYGRFLNLYTLSYNANAPAGAAVGGTMQSAEVVEGTAANVAANAYTAEGYRFLGWSTAADGEVDVGATLELERNTTLYAVWQKGYRNQLDNGDYLYISGEHAVLVRGDEEYAGVYHADAKTFEVTVGEESVTGRLFENNTYSCFGEHSLGEYALYNAYTNEAVNGGKTLELFDNRIAEYDGQRAAYEYIGDGNYSLTCGSAELVFKLGTVAVEESELLVYCVRGGEAGEYTLYGGKPTLKLDGYGNLGYSQYGNDSYAPATYTVNADGSIAWNDDKVKVDGEYYAVYNDALEHTYSSGSDTLVLDGYMGATLNGDAGMFAAKPVEGVDGTFVTVAVGDVEQAYKLDGATMVAVGNEIGKYEQYDNGTYVSPSVYFYLYGNGNAKVEAKKSAWGTALEIKAEGSYAVNLDGSTWTFTPNSDYSSYGSFTFIIKTLSNGIVFVKCNDTYKGTYSNGDDRLVLDGYGNAVYTKAGEASVSDSYKCDSATTVTMGSNKFTVDTSAKTFTIASLSGTFNLNTNRGSSSSPRENDMRIKLSGDGTAQMQRYEYDWGSDDNTWTNYATGTFRQEGNNIYRWIPNSSYATKEPEFQFTISGSYYSKADESAVFNYTNGEQTLNKDGFGTVVYTDADGAAHTGSYSVSGNYATLDSSDGLYTFKLDEQNNTFVVIGNEIGEYTLSGGATAIELDGEGGAILTEPDSEQNIVGTYVATGEEKEYTFTSASGLTFTFRTFVVQSSNKYEVAYEHANSYLGANDFNMLVLDSYGGAQYINETGAVEYGEYVVLSEHIVRYNPAKTKAYSYFRIDYDNGLFVKDESDFLIENGVLVAYAGEGGEIVLPNEVTAIAENAFQGNGNVTSVDLNNVTAIGKGAFENCAELTSVVGLKVTDIGEAAFKSDTLLHTASFGDKVAHIGKEAFYGVSSSLKEHALAVEINGAAIPQIGESAFSYNDYESTFKVDSLEVALSWFGDESAAAYSGKITFGADSTSSTYYDLAEWSISNEMVLSAGRAKCGSSGRWLYVVNGDNITFYAYDATAENKYTTTEVTLNQGLFALSGKTYAVEGTAVTYTDADSNVLIVTLGKELSATYNGEQIALDKTVSNYTFELQIAGNGYTVTIKSYGATSATDGTFTATKAFKEKTFSLTFADGRSSMTLKQTNVNEYTLSSNAYLLIPGDSSTTTVRKDSSYSTYVYVHRTTTGFTIIDTYSNSSPKVYYLTEANGEYSVSKDSGSFKRDYKSISGNQVIVYTNTTTHQIVHVALKYNSKEYSGYTLQDDGIYLFDNVDGKSYIVNVTVNTSTNAISSATITEKVSA